MFSVNDTFARLSNVDCFRDVKSMCFDLSSLCGVFAGNTVIAVRRPAHDCALLIARGTSNDIQVCGSDVIISVSCIRSFKSGSRLSTTC